MSLLAAGVAAVAVATSTPVDAAARYVLTRQTEGGGFAEVGAQPSAHATAWSVLGLAAARKPIPRDATAFLAEHERDFGSAADVALLTLARTGAGSDAGAAVARLRRFQRPNGAIGPTVNSTAWGVLALTQARATVPTRTIAYLLRAQTRSGGWSWSTGVAPDSNDTAATIQALWACGVRGRPIRRGLAYLRTLQNRDGGFELTSGRGSDTQSTAWAIQAFLAARQPPGAKAYAYLARMRRADGSYRYSARYVTTPLWVTAQVLPALARRPFPLR